MSDSSDSSDDFVYRATKKRRLDGDDGEEEMTQAWGLEPPERKNVLLEKRMSYLELQRQNFMLMYENGELKQKLELSELKKESYKRQVVYWKAKFQGFFKG